MRVKVLLALLVFGLVGGAALRAPAQDSAPPRAAPVQPQAQATAARSLEAAIGSVTVDELMAHEKVLASDEYMGRASGEQGGRMAGAYIAGKLKAWGLTPLGDNGTYFQNFAGRGGAALGENNTLSLWVAGIDGEPDSTTKFTVKKDFMPFGFSANGSASGEVVFAGYGITAPEYRYDDYAGLNVKGKLVLVLRREPGTDDPQSPFKGTQNTEHATFVSKARNAMKHGAAGMLLVNRPSAARDRFVGLSGGRGGITIPCAQLSRGLANKLFEFTGTNLAKLQTAIDTETKPYSRRLKYKKVTFSVELTKGAYRNVVALLEGTDPARKKEHVILGAHYDHLGYGNFGALDGRGEIHNGADDNASGTTVLLELAQAFVSKAPRLPRSIVFIWFDAEERGLVGSGYYANNPKWPLKDCVGMLNLDMVGRVTNKKLSLGGTGSSPDWPAAIEAAKANIDLTVTQSKPVRPDSDQASFYRKDLPVLFLFSGMHRDYHRATDDWQKLNFPGMREVAKLALKLGYDLATREGRIRFTRAQSSRPGPRTRARVRLGIMPDYDSQGGIAVTDVTPGTPAAKAGMKSGDKILSIGGTKTPDIQALMRVLAKHKPGDKVAVVVERDGKQLTLNVTFAPPAGR